MDWVVSHLDLSWIEHPGVRQIIAARLSAHETGAWQGVPGLLDVCPEDSSRSLITEAIAEDHPKETLQKNIVGAVLKLRNDFLDRQLAALTQRLAELALSQPDLVSIVQQQQALREARRRPLEPLGDA